MNRILTWLEFKDQLKTELGIQEDTDPVNDLLLALANEALTQIAQSGENLRDFTAAPVFAIINSAFVSSTVYAWANIEQVYYQQIDDGSGEITFEWDLAEQSNIVGPSPINGRPNAYTVTQGPASAAGVTTIFEFVPYNTARVNDKIKVVGTALRLIALDADLLHYPSLYPFIKLFVIERYRVHRNESPEKVQLVSGMLNRAGAGASQGTADEPKK